MRFNGYRKDEEGSDFGVAPRSKYVIQSWNIEEEEPLTIHLYPHECSLIKPENLEIYLHEDCFCPVGFQFTSEDAEKGSHVLPMWSSGEEFETLLGSLLLDGYGTCRALYEMCRMVDSEDVNYYLSCVPAARSMLESMFGAKR